MLIWDKQNERSVILRQICLKIETKYLSKNNDSPNMFYDYDQSLGFLEV